MDVSSPPMDRPERDNGQLKTTVSMIPALFLMSIFDYFDAVCRLHMTRVCKEWKSLLLSRQMTTKGVFVDFDSIFARFFLPADLQALENYVNSASKGRSSIWFRSQYEGKAQRIIFCDSGILEEILELHDRAPSLLAENTEAEDSESFSDGKEDEDSYRAKYQRPMWASVSVEEISFRNCHVFFQSVPHWRIEISCASMDTLIFSLDRQVKCWDLICAARDAYNEEPGSSERRKVKKSMQIMEKQFGNVQSFTKNRTEFLQKRVSNIPEAIGQKPTAELVFSTLNNSSLYLLSEFSLFA